MPDREAPAGDTPSPADLGVPSRGEDQAVGARTPPPPAGAPAASAAPKYCPQCGTEYESTLNFCPRDGNILQARHGEHDLVGQVLGRHYRILELLGEGGMGQVFLAEHVRIGRRCAVKVMRPALTRDSGAVGRFGREATTAGRINHRNAAAVYDFGETDEGLIYIVMEHVEGPPLSRVLAREGALPPARAVDIALQLTAALMAAHRLGIIHRDLKPDNILIARDDNGADLVKVVDFGIAKAMNSDSEQSLTRTGFVLGTLQYMSPEQLIGEPLDGRSDLYSVGCILFEMLTGERTFAGPSGPAAMARRLTDPAPSPRSRKPSLSAELDAIVLRALARVPADRFQSAEEMRATLLAALEGGAASEVAPDAPIAEASPPTPVAMPALVLAPEAAAPSTDSATAVLGGSAVTPPPVAPRQHSGLEPRTGGEMLGRGAEPPLPTPSLPTPAAPAPAAAGPPAGPPPAAHESGSSAAVAPPDDSPSGGTSAVAPTDAAPGPQPAPLAPAAPAAPDTGPRVAAPGSVPRPTWWRNPPRLVAATVVALALAVGAFAMARRWQRPTPTATESAAGPGAPGTPTPAAGATSPAGAPHHALGGGTTSPPTAGPAAKDAAAPPPAPEPRGTPAPATVSIDGRLPKGAAVLVDGSPVKRTPVTLQPGRHTLAVLAAGFQPFEWTGSLVTGEHRRLTVALKAVPPVAPPQSAATAAPAGPPTLAGSPAPAPAAVAPRETPATPAPAAQPPRPDAPPDAAPERPRAAALARTRALGEDMAAAITARDAAALRRAWPEMPPDLERRWSTFLSSPDNRGVQARFLYERAPQAEANTLAVPFTIEVNFDNRMSGRGTWRSRFIAAFQRAEDAWKLTGVRAEQ